MTGSGNVEARSGRSRSSGASSTGTRLGRRRRASSDECSHERSQLSSGNPARDGRILFHVPLRRLFVGRLEHAHAGVDGTKCRPGENEASVLESVLEQFSMRVPNQPFFLGHRGGEVLAWGVDEIDPLVHRQDRNEGAIGVHTDPAERPRSPSASRSTTGRCPKRSHSRRCLTIGRWNETVAGDPWLTSCAAGGDACVRESRPNRVDSRYPNDLGKRHELAAPAR